MLFPRKKKRIDFFSTIQFFFSDLGAVVALSGHNRRRRERELLRAYVQWSFFPFPLAFFCPPGKKYLGVWLVMEKKKALVRRGCHSSSSPSLTFRLNVPPPSRLLHAAEEPIGADVIPTYYYYAFCQASSFFAVKLFSSFLLSPPFPSFSPFFSFHH